ncbi:sensory box sensor histidine kinase/response regulator, putative [Microscilla marina ATCC 23134]|uniref:histidine kinase n=1 Tax=Microscilla marina ATCC 23134 TaxID=313606 RepID=A1ZGG7_MICM2|nr:sensory box sensor histidine kinase/response regulator, putative [Microscilla marina ATCC 23134]
MLPKFISLRFKLLTTFLFFSIIIIVVASIGFWFHSKSSKISTIAVNLENVLVNTFKVIKLEQDFFDYETNNPNFYAQGSSKYITKHKNLVADVNKHLYTLVSFEEVQALDIDQTVVETEAKKILHELQNYETSFDQIVQLTRRLGFKNYGIKGEMQRYTEALEKLTSLNQIKLLTLKQYERDYLILKDIKYAQQLEKLCLQWQTDVILNPQVRHNDKIRAQQLLRDYLKTFKEMVALKQRIGVGAGKGLTHELRAYADNLSKFTQNFVSKINQRAANISADFENIFIAMVIATVVLSIVMSIYFSTVITRPIVGLSRYINKTVNSNFSENLSIKESNSQDEVGQLTRNFNRMLQEMQRQLTEIREQSLILEHQNEELNNVNELSQASEEHLIKLNVVKDKLLAILSHDLRSPFNTIKGFLQVLLHHINGFSKDEIRHFAEDMDKAVQRVIDLLENLLQWSLVQTDDFEYVPEEFDLAPVIQDNVVLYEKAALEKQISLMIHIEPQTYVKADKNMLDFVLRNLLSNAIKFTYPKNQINIYTKREGDFIKVSIIDKGVGIKADALEKIFSPEIHLSTHGTANEKGTGFGLLLCKEFVEKNGGQLEIESEEGVGTQVMFQLQAIDQPEM